MVYELQYFINMLCFIVMFLLYYIFVLAVLLSVHCVLFHLNFCLFLVHFGSVLVVVLTFCSRRIAQSRAAVAAACGR